MVYHTLLLGMCRLAPCHQAAQNNLLVTQNLPLLPCGSRYHYLRMFVLNYECCETSTTM